MAPVVETAIPPQLRNRSGAMFEAIPEDLILEAALVAAAQMLGPVGAATDRDAHANTR